MVHGTVHGAFALRTAHGLDARPLQRWGKHTTAAKPQQRHACSCWISRGKMAGGGRAICHARIRWAVAPRQGVEENGLIVAA